MKDKGISRDVGGRIKRTAGDAPSLGHVGRMTKASEHPGRRRRRRVTEEERAIQSKKGARNNSLIVTLTLAAVGIAAIATFFFLWLKPFIENRDRLVQESKRASSVAPAAAPADFRSIGEREAIELTKRALKSRDEAEVEKTINTGETPVADVIAYLTKLKASEGEITRYDWVTRLDTTRTDIEGVLVTFKNDVKEGNRLALLSPDERGNWKLDFAAFARLASPSWDEVITGKADSAVVRVYVAADSYFNGPFQDSDGWRCYGLASPDLPDLFFGYCKADSPQGRALSMVLMDNKKLSRVTLEIARVAGAEKRQYEIKRVLAQDWAIGPKAFDEE